LEALKRGFFAIGVPQYLVLWNVNFVRARARNPESRKMALRSIFVRAVKNISSDFVNRVVNRIVVV
jgi:hypothetical protein